jgi:hypothetical protein
MVIQPNPLWPMLFAAAGILLVIRGFIRIRKNPEVLPASRLFLLLAACLFVAAGVADMVARLTAIGKW